MGGVVSSIFGGDGGGGGSVPSAPPYSQYDPYGAIGGRTDAANQLKTLMSDPSAALSQPGYQMTLQQGTAAQQAAGAASGTLQSGGQAAALQGYGQNIFNQYYNQLYNQLGTLSGATTQTPASASQAQYNGQIQQTTLQNQIQQQNAALGLGLTGILGQGLYSSGIFGGSGGMSTLGGYGSATEGSSNFIGPLSSMGGYAGGASSAGGVYDLAYMAV
jgi:hypothetical protein